MHGAYSFAEGFRVSPDVTYDDSRYLTYSNVSPTQLQQLLGETSQNLTGRPTEFAPVWSGTLTESYTVKFSAFRLTTALTEIASSSYYLTGNDDPTVEQSPYFRLDARTSLETADGRWALDVIAKNITNRDILAFGIVWPTSLGSTWVQREEPRNIAGQVRYRW